MSWYSFGRGLHGELGRELAQNVEVPGQENADVQPLAEVPGISILSCGHFHNLALTDGEVPQVYAWGANLEGQLALEGAAEVPKSSQLQALPSDDPVVHLAAGRSHSVFVTRGGRSFLAGRLAAAEPGAALEPAQVREIQLTDASKRPEGKVVACAAGESQTFFLSDEGELWSWLGEGQARGRLERPTARAVLGLPRVAKVACGLHHTLILTEERHVYSFGAGSMGQLGLGACRRCPSPSKVTFPKQCEGSIRGIAAGFASSFAVTAHGWVYSWGCNEKCELGLGAAVRGTATPKPLDSLYQVKVVQVAAGFSHTACVTDSGLLYLWGYGAYGQLGFGFDDLRSSMRLGRGWSATKPGQGGRAGEGGFALTGQWQPWQQAWPRRCRRGPFRTRRCKSVQCGAYHTMAEASEELLGPGALRESEVLCPLPLELSDLPADAKEVDHRLPPGAGLVECPRSVLRNAAPRTVEIFRSLADLFWDTTAPKRQQSDAPKQAPLPNCAKDGAWRRALKAPVRPEPSVPHPLAPVPHHSSPRPQKALQAFPLPGTGPAMATWTEVDDAIHKAFADGRAAQRGAADVAQLVAELLEVSGPEPKEATGLPASPCRGLARLECLTPRPFYLPDQEPSDGWLNVHGAPKPVEDEELADGPGAKPDSAEAVHAADSAGEAAAEAADAPDSPVEAVAEAVHAADSAGEAAAEAADAPDSPVEAVAEAVHAADSAGEAAAEAADAQDSAVEAVAEAVHAADSAGEAAAEAADAQDSAVEAVAEADMTVERGP
ncbi:unnamed protein product [Effrenium voratum]|uniref:RCC1-like domain-containing protein n=1 Tax=Effrenium voratum TaxID=2562239 RepID=A0AA36JDC5_9DINO|nr:unnamed protein product [Effrenium voratum]